MVVRAFRVSAWIAGAALVSGGIVAANTAAQADNLSIANAQALEAGALTTFAQQAKQVTLNGYYKMPYSDDVWYYGGSGSPYHVSYDQWRSAGSPTPVIAPTRFGKVPGHDDIWAQTEFGETSNTWVTAILPFAAWAKAGYPQPTVTDPTPAFARNVVQWQGSDEVFYASAVIPGAWEKLTFAAWLNLGAPTPLFQLDRGISKLPWSDVVSQLSSWRTGAGKTLSFADWVRLGQPRPTVVNGYPGQKFCSRGGADIYYYGGGINGMKMTFSQWVAAGGPRPTTC